MIIFLYGPDDYRRLQKKREILAEFKKKHSDLGVCIFDMTSGATDDLEEFLRAQSIFENKKLAVIENLFPREKRVAVMRRAKTLKMARVKRKTRRGSLNF